MKWKLAEKKISKSGHPHFVQFPDFHPYNIYIYKYSLAYASLAMRKQVNAFEFWCYRRILKISWRDRIKNDEILKRLQKRLHFVEDMMKRKLRYAGHVFRGSSGLSHLQILEGFCGGKKKSG